MIPRKNLAWDHYKVFDEYRNFLSKNHKYRTTEKDLFNGKQETGLKPQRMTKGQTERVLFVV